MEIILGKERRRWPDEAKRAIVAETERAGETVTDVARRHGINASMLFAWRKRFQASSSRSDETPPALAPRFVPLAIASPPALPGPYMAPTIELQLAGGAHVKIVGAADPDLVATVLKALPRR